MEKSATTLQLVQLPQEEHKSKDEIMEKVRELELYLPRKKGFMGPYLYFYQGFWCPSPHLPGVVSIHNQFQAHETDIVIVSKPKSGTTWLKALAFTIINRRIYPTNNQDRSKPHPLLTHNPHDLVPFMEINRSSLTRFSDVSKPTHPRLLSSHLPYNALPEPIKKSGCRIVYICRNILDTVVSYLMFSQRSKEAWKEENGGSKEKDESITLDDYLNSVCDGVEGFGPHWDHVLGYWKKSLETPTTVLFVKYEDVKGDEKEEMKRLAVFIGCPFSSDEEKSGVIDEISRLCSIGNLKELEVNKQKRYGAYTKNDMFFRKGEVGDWMNHMTMTPSMAEDLEGLYGSKVSWLWVKLCYLLMLHVPTLSLSCT